MSILPFTITLSVTDLAAYVARQLVLFFPDRDESTVVRSTTGETVERMEHCVRHVRMKGWWTTDGPRFDHLHTDQYAVFLYYLANTAHQHGERSLAAKAYALNKALHGLDAFYEVELPAIFALVHPVGTVLGRASYGDYFCAYQNVAVGSDLEHRHPVLGRGVVLYGGARVLGGATIGDNCMLSTGCTLLGDDVPKDHIAFGAHKALTLKASRRNVIADIFKDV